MGNWDIRHRYNGGTLNVAAQASVGNGISKVRYEISIPYNGQTISKTYEYTYGNFPATVNLNYTNTNDAYQLNSYIGTYTSNQISTSNGTFTCYVYDKFNNVVEQTGTANVILN